MKGVEIYNADTFEEVTAGLTTGIKEGSKTKWVRTRMIGFFSLRHNLKCAWEVFQGKADIIRFYKQ